MHALFLLQAQLPHFCPSRSIMLIGRGGLVERDSIHRFHLMPIGGTATESDLMSLLRANIFSRHTAESLIGNVRVSMGNIDLWPSLKLHTPIRASLLTEALTEEATSVWLGCFLGKQKPSGDGSRYSSQGFSTSQCQCPAQVGSYHDMSSRTCQYLS